MQWMPFFSFILSTCYTPGPNIIYAMNTARVFGFRKTIPLISGMVAGLLGIMSLNAFANIFIAEIMPQVFPWLRIIGSIYLLYLAWKIAFPQNTAGRNSEQEKVPGISDGLILQFLNPKVILFGFTAMSTFIAPWTRSGGTFFICGIFLTINCGIALILWALFGNVQHRRFSAQGQTVGIIMGLMLVWCAFSVSGAADFF